MPPKPLIVGFDTSAAHVAAALVSGDQILAEHYEERARGQDQVLFPVLEGLLSRADVAWSDVQAIGVGVGPGNFTGVRIAVAAAKGLSLSLNIPAIGVTMFDAMRYGYDGAVYTAVSAPRGAAYVDAGSQTSPRLVAAPNDIEPYHNPKAEPRFVGAVGQEWVDALHSQRVPAKHMCATAIAMVARDRFVQGREILPPKPMYIKSPDAAPPRVPPPQIIP